MMVWASRRILSLLKSIRLSLQDTYITPGIHFTNAFLRRRESLLVFYYIMPSSVRPSVTFNTANHERQQLS
jgi:hypothetical protein